MTGTPRARIRDLRREWATLHPWLRPTVVALLTAGTVLAVLGAAGDAAEVWSRFPFLTNLASSLTGALFGLPVALVVVQRLLQAQTEANDRAAAWRLAIRSVHSMRIAAVTLSGADLDSAAAELARLVARCDTAIAEAREWADQALTAKARPRRLRGSMYQRNYLRQVLTLHHTVQQALNVYATTGMAAEASVSALERIRSEATFLYDHVRPMVLRLDGRWLAQPHARALERVDDSFPADLPRIGVRQRATIKQLLDAMPASQLAALLPESDAIRADLPEPDLPLPLPPVERLQELHAELVRLVTQLDRVRQIARVVDGIRDAVDLLAD
ncbi:hypothetical protein [Couchioplanes caeruleus]|nr:hypothetical protein [Couchioplanes caeruleus]